MEIASYAFGIIAGIATALSAVFALLHHRDLALWFLCATIVFSVIGGFAWLQDNLWKRDRASMEVLSEKPPAIAPVPSIGTQNLTGPGAIGQANAPVTQNFNTDPDTQASIAAIERAVGSFEYKRRDHLKAIFNQAYYIFAFSDHDNKLIIPQESQLKKSGLIIDWPNVEFLDDPQMGKTIHFPRLEMNFHGGARGTFNSLYLGLTEEQAYSEMGRTILSRDRFEVKLKIFPEGTNKIVVLGVHKP